MNIDKNWLPQFTNEMIKGAGARNNNLCTYLIALEGWRRGLKLTFDSQKVKKQEIHAPGREFSLSSSKRTHLFYKTKGDKVSVESLKLTGNKDEAKKIFAQHGVPTPEGKRFLENADNDEIIEYVKVIGFPVVVKPTNGYQGIGVIANITDEDYLRKSLEYVRSELGYQDVLVERFFCGEEYRIFVIENDVIAAIKRIPANIVGDGVNTIEELINIKNAQRKRNPRLYTCLIDIDFEVKKNLESLDLTLGSILEEGRQIFLREKSNISTGGDSVDVLDGLPDELKIIAIDALKSMPSLPHAGVDIIFNKDLSIEESAVVLEINAIPQIGSLVFPMKGKARDIPGHIIDYYFPETKKKTNYNPRVYFDFRKVLEPLKSKIASEVIVTPAPREPSFAKKYVITGIKQSVRYQRWIRKQALEADLFGYIQNRVNDSIIIIVAGKKEAVNNFKLVCMNPPSYINTSEIPKIIESDWNRAIKVGFEIKAAQKNKAKKTLKNEQIQKPKKQQEIQAKEQEKITFRQIVKKILKKVLN